MPLYNACTDLLDRNIEAGRGDKIAYIDHERAISFRELQTETRRFANLLVSLGVRREERIALILADTIEYPIAILGAMRAGVVPVLLNTLLTSEQYSYMLSDSRAAAAFVSEPLLAAVEPALSALPVNAKVFVASGPAGAHEDFSKALAAQSADFTTADTHSDEPAFWLYSSGSTGAPRARNTCTPARC